MPDAGFAKSSTSTSRPIGSGKPPLRGEAVNAFYHLRFGGPNTDPAGAKFGVVDPFQQIQPPVLQLAIQINF